MEGVEGKMGLGKDGGGGGGGGGGVGRMDATFNGYRGIQGCYLDLHSQRRDKFQFISAE